MLASSALLALTGCSAAPGDPAVARRDFLAQFRKVAAAGKGCDDSFRLLAAASEQSAAAALALAGDARAVCVAAATDTEAAEPPATLGSDATGATSRALDCSAKAFRARAASADDVAAALGSGGGGEADRARDSVDAGRRASIRCVDAWFVAARAVGVSPGELAPR